MKHRHEPANFDDEDDMELVAANQSFESVKIASDSATAESHTRSLLKGITWRFVATMTTVVISWIVIGDVSTALQIGFFEAILKIGIYYLHERIWARIPV